MNRHDRRSAKAGNRKRLGNWYDDYIRHLPRVPIDAPFEVGVHHLVLFHDDWCRIYETGNPADCNCYPRVERHAKPRRS